jgi:hypothetical protein
MGTNHDESVNASVLVTESIYENALIGAFCIPIAIVI